MSLTLTITSYRQLLPDQETSKTVEKESLSFGRAPHNDWILQDPERILSGQHGIIQYQDGSYYITDTSTNGIFLNDSEQRLERGQRVKLHPGDWLTMGDYEITVDIGPAESHTETADIEEQFTDIVPTPESVSPDSPSGLSGADVVTDIFAAPSTPGKPELSSAEILPEDSGLLGIGQPVRTPSTERVTEPDHLSPERELFQPPESEIEKPVEEPQPVTEPVAPEEPVIPEDWWQEDPFKPQPEIQPPGDETPSSKPLSEEPIIPPATEHPPPEEADEILSATPQKPKPALKSPPPAANKSDSPRADITEDKPAPQPPGPSGPTALQHFLQGAGIPRLHIPDDRVAEVMTHMGAIFRETIRGIMEVLLARSSVKGEFRLDRTTLGPMDNNPLKTPPGRSPLSEEEVMALLLGVQEQGFMPPVDAVRESFDDIKAHQLAVMAGIQTALDHLLERFDPQKLERRLGEHSMLDNLLPGKRKAKYWDSYTELYEELAKEAQDDFNELFGKEFARAYEAHIRNL